MTDKQLREMAKTDPEALIRIVANGDLPAHELTFALEYMGSIRDDWRVTHLLGLACHHSNDTVVEGAIYGLIAYGDEHYIRDHIGYLAAYHKSPLIRKIAQDALDD